MQLPGRVEVNYLLRFSTLNLSAAAHPKLALPSSASSPIAGLRA
jgi:hypothetical protein